MTEEFEDKILKEKDLKELLASVYHPEPVLVYVPQDEQ